MEKIEEIRNKKVKRVCDISKDKEKFVIISGCTTEIIVVNGKMQVINK